MGRTFELLEIGNFSQLYGEKETLMQRSKKKYDLSNIIPMLSADTLNVASGMIDDAVFLGEQIEELREKIREEGVSEEYQYGSKQTAAVTTYLQMQKQYGVIIRYLTDLLPKTDKTAAAVSLADWVANN